MESVKTDRQLAVLAYGSLLAHPGDWLGQNMERLTRCDTPFGVEYFGQAGRRGNAPTLVQASGSPPVKGGLIVLPFKDNPTELEEVRYQLARREGIAVTRGVPVTSTSIKHDQVIMGFRVVYSDFRAHRAGADAQTIARAAIDSVDPCVRSLTPFMNGIRYLAENIEWGVTTRLTEAYRAAILQMAAPARTLEEAEDRELAKAYKARP